MSFISNSPQHGCDGISDDVTSEITPTNGTPGLGGSISVSYDGMLKMTCTSTNPAGGSAATMGGNGSNGVVTSQSTHCGSGSTSHTPATLTAYTQYDTKTWKYGKGGNPGDFQSLFITSLKQAIPIILGEGGAAGDNSTGSSGDTGTATKFGNLLSATGGIGGQGNLSFGPYQVGTFPAGLTNVGGSYVKYGDDGFSSSTIFSFEAITGIFAASGLGSIGNYGRGGNGGGTVSTCNSSNLKHYFNGSLISQISSTCSDGSYIVDYYTDSKQAGTPSTPQKGFSGALIVIW
jgi:hypothetical protein